MLAYRWHKPPILRQKFGAEPWFKSVLGYLVFRYHPIEDRLLGTFRYVDLHPKNKDTFSYEYGGILRDIGSTFSSVLDNLVRNTTTKPQTEYNIVDYLKFLTHDATDIELIGAQLNMPFNLNMFLPFENIKSSKNAPKERLVWWTPYNNLKHKDIDSYQEGSLSNVLYGMASLAILYALMAFFRKQAEGKMFSSIGFFTPINEAKKLAFPKSYASVPNP